MLDPPMTVFHKIKIKIRLLFVWDKIINVFGTPLLRDAISYEKKGYCEFK
jgi:hypothetical protein